MPVSVAAEPDTPAPSSFEAMLALHRPDPTVRVWPGTDPGAAEPPAPVMPPDRDRPWAGDRMRALTAGLGATARIVLYLAPDLDLTFGQIAYTALWAPRVAQDMARRESSSAFLSRDTLSAVTGLSGQKAMAPGGVVETSAAAVGLVRMVARGMPGAVSRTDGRGWRGEATSWTVTGDPDGFTHHPRRTGQAATAEPEPGRTPLDPAELDRAAVDIWADPRFGWWRGQAAGPTGLRLIATLLAGFGVTDVLLGTADVAALTGVHRQTAWSTMRGLDRLGLACKEGKHGRWRVRIASHLARLTGDDLKYLTRRQAPPGQARAKVHDWGWFTPEGRHMRKRARSVLTDVPDVAQEVAAPDAKRTDARTGWLRGALMGTVELLRRCDQMGHEAAARVMGRLVRPELGGGGHKGPQASERPSEGRWQGAQDRTGREPAVPRPAPASAARAVFENTATFVSSISSAEEGLEILRRERQELDAQAAAARAAAPEPSWPPAAPQRPAQTLPAATPPPTPPPAEDDWLAKVAHLLVSPQPLVE